MEETNRAPSLFRQALEASRCKEFDKALDLFEDLTAFEGYRQKAYAFSKYDDRLKECDVDFLKAMAEKGHAIARRNLGYCYDGGQGVAQDCNKAVRLYRLAADQGYAVAQSNLGYCYAHGQGVAQDYGEAVRWYRLAADQGLAIAQRNLERCQEFL